MQDDCSRRLSYASRPDGRWPSSTADQFEGSAVAKVSAEEAARLGKDLTPVGAEKAGNKDGTIPAWEGGLDKSGEPYKDGDRVRNPWPDDKPLYVIDKSNYEEHKAKLSVGQIEMLTRYLVDDPA